MNEAKTKAKQAAQNVAESKPQKTHLALSVGQSLGILGSSLALGVAGDYLFRGYQLGLGWSVFVCLSVAVLYIWKRQLKTDTVALLLAGAVALLAILFSWRDSNFLAALNIAVTLFLSGLIVARLSPKLFFKTNFPDIGINLFRTLLSPVISFFSFWGNSRWHELSRYKGSSRAGSVTALIRGLVFALPLLLVFALLLSAADATFEGLLNQLFKVDIEAVLGHGFFTLFLGSVMLALFSQTLTGLPWVETKSNAPTLLTFGTIETGIVFGSLIALFSAFMLVQFGYMFGGEQMIAGSDVTYAQYGRRGFFELVTVTVLLHLVLLTGLWLVRPGNAARLYRLLAALLVVLLFGLIWSAHRRLGLYIDSYGLTELRYYSSAMIFFIGVVMVYFLVRLFYKAAPRVAPSYIVLGVLGVLALYISNPDARIAATNLNRDEAVPIDVAYFVALSLDAAPAIQTYLDSTPNRELQHILKDKVSSASSDWRGANWGSWRAKQLVE